jgi:hypothetical protein
MMKMNFRKIGILAVLAIILLSGRAQAVSNDENGNRKEGKVPEVKKEVPLKFCENLGKYIQKMETLTERIRQEISQKREARLANWEENTAERDEKLSQKRNLRDENFEKHFAGLEEKARTEEQKKAAKKFQEAMEKAIAARRSAIDDAIENFRTAVAALHKDRKTSIDAETEEFINTQKTAIEKARSECAQNSNQASVRQAVKNSLALAKKNFSQSKQNAEKIRTQMETLIQTRKSAIEKANSDFKAAIEKAKTEFKKEFGSVSDDNQ